MSDLLTIGASGAAAYRSALEMVGNNIVNAETPGYARRQVVLKESPTSSGTNALYRSRAQFGGVDPFAVKRAWDDFRAADSRFAASAAARSDTRVRWLDALEGGLADGPTGVGQSVTAVFTSATALASDPGNTFSRRAFLNAVDGTASAFRTTADGLSRLSAGIAAEATTVVEAANADIAALAKLNAALRRAGSGTATSVQLADERDRLLDDLSAKIEVESVVASDGTVAISLARSGGVQLVDNTGIGPALLSVSQAADGRLSLSVFADGESSTVHPAAGALAGAIEAAGIVADRRTELDTLAASFAAKLNAWSAAGTDANGDAGTALLAFDPLAAAATLKPAVANRDPATLAAALSVDNGDGTTTVTANGNLLSLGTLRATEGTETGWATMVAAQSQILNSARSEQATASARRDGAFSARDEIAGVDLDHEASELLRFQQAYNGSAKIIQVARETLQTIMDVL